MWRSDGEARSEKHLFLSACLMQIKKEMKRSKKDGERRRSEACRNDGEARRQGEERRRETQRKREARRCEERRREGVRLGGVQ